MSNSYYFDYASTTICDEEILKKYHDLSLIHYYNDEALYLQARNINKAVSEASNRILSLFKIKNYKIIYTSGASEANNLALKGLALAFPKRKHIIISAYEHSSIIESVKWLEKFFNCEITYLNPDINGKIEVSELAKYLRKDTLLVSIMAVNNVLGSINDLSALSDYVKNNSHAYFHSDVCQGIAKTDIDYGKLDLFSFSAHKLNGLKGSGALIFKDNIRLEALLSGGTQQFALRAGTNDAIKNILLADTLFKAFKNQVDDHLYLKKLLLYFKEKLNHNYEFILEEHLVSIIALKTKLKSEVMINALANFGIMISAKSTCSQKIKKQHNSFEKILNYDSDYMIRISFSVNTKIIEIDYLLDKLDLIAKEYTC